MTASERANAIIGRLVRKGLREHVSRILDPLFEACREELEAALVASNLAKLDGVPTVREVYEKLPGHTIGDEVYFHGGDVLTALEKERERLAAALHERDAYKKAKAENDERFMNERDEARAELNALKSRRAADNPCVDHCNCQPRWQTAYVNELCKREELEKANTKREERSKKLSHLHTLVTSYNVIHGGVFLHSAVQALLEGGDEEGMHRTGVFRQRSREEGQAAALSAVCYAAMVAITQEDGRTCSEGRKAWHALKEAHSEFGIEGNRSINLAELSL